MKHLVLDANILIRAVLGIRAAQHIRGYASVMIFLTLEEAFEDATTYLPEVLSRRGLENTVTHATLQKLDALRRVIHVIPIEMCVHLQSEAQERLKGRDQDDWP